MRKDLNFKSLFLILYLVSLVMIGDLESEYSSFFVSYYKYSITSIAFYFFLISNKGINTQAFYYFGGLIFIFLWSFVFNLSVTITNLLSIFVLLAVLPAFIFKWNFEFDDYKLEVGFYIIGFVFLALNLFKIINQNFDSFMLSGQSSDSESFLFPFILGIIAFYFFSKNKRFSFTFFVILTFLTGKRSVFLALCLVCLIQLLFPRNVVYKNRVVFGLVLNVLALGLIYMFTIGFFNEVLLEYFEIKSIGAFSAGRSSINGFVFDHFGSLSIYEKIFGIGFGEISKYIGEFFFMGNFWNAHNEILRLLIEIGILGLFVFVVIFYKYTSEENIFLFIFINIIMLFTNVFIYPVVIFIFYLVSNSLNFKKIT